ncbi:SET domain-containing protein [Salinimicrobium sediminilitoris]|uniref:SET domain-containing protein n=1 Tax=Salinimicrobium sediminilitoris TaxID=2876715 RepID=UPI001E527E8F|nr:SET domain-containing protein [Salinimicrobium sediminilitoris]MCC8359281.1 SET domain-containing protein [Salinimicrobium sediminilitoris]
MMHPDTEVRFINDVVGYGVVAKKFIPRGTITWVQDDLDQLLTENEVEKMHPDVQEQVEKYCFRNNKGQLVLCWDLAKYVNHSFNANCLSSAYDFEVAVRDIEPGEQLTDDYGYLNISEPFKAVDEGTGRDTVYPDDLLKYHEKWDRQLEGAFENFEHVEQPLIKLVSSAVLEKIKSSLAKNEPLDSILNLYYEEK